MICFKNYEKINAHARDEQDQAFHQYTLYEFNDWAVRRNMLREQIIRHIRPEFLVCDHDSVIIKAALILISLYEG